MCEANRFACILEDEHSIVDGVMKLDRGVGAPMLTSLLHLYLYFSLQEMA